MKYLPLLFMFTATLAFSQQTAMQQLQEKMQKAELASTHQSEEKHNAPSQSDLLIITPSERVKDYVEAFHILKKEKNTSQIVYVLHDGTMLENINEVSTLPGATMILFKMNTTKGLKYRVVPVEDISHINVN